MSKNRRFQRPSVNEHSVKAFNMSVQQTGKGTYCGFGTRYVSRYVSTYNVDAFGHLLDNPIFRPFWMVHLDMYVDINIF